LPARTLRGEIETTSGVQQAVDLKKQLVAKVKEDPESASRLIQNWIHAEERESK
jgi:flagellar biosynthesis/type III secretory pathway M-ring protein FliF/YscJ